MESKSKGSNADGAGARAGAGAGDERQFFVMRTMELINPYLQEELKRMGKNEDTEFSLEVAILMQRLLGRFYEIGKTEATMYMPMIMMALRKLK